MVQGVQKLSPLGSLWGQGIGHQVFAMSRTAAWKVCIAKGGKGEGQGPDVLDRGETNWRKRTRWNETDGRMNWMDLNCQEIDVKKFGERSIWIRDQIEWNEMKWNEMKWNEMKSNELYHAFHSMVYLVMGIRTTTAAAPCGRLNMCCSTNDLGRSMKLRFNSSLLKLTMRRYCVKVDSALVCKLRISSWAFINSIPRLSCSRACASKVLWSRMDPIWLHMNQIISFALNDALLKMHHNAIPAGKYNRHQKQGVTFLSIHVIWSENSLCL